MAQKTTDSAFTATDTPPASTTLVEESIAITLTANNLVKDYVIASVALGAVPVPLLDLAGVAGIQLRMIQKLSQLYGKPFSQSLGRSVIASLAGSFGGFTAGLVAASVVKAVPGIGWALSMATMPAVAGASTYAIGKVFVKHYEEGGSLGDLDTAKFKAFYKEQFEKGKVMAKQAADEAKARASAVKDAATGASPTPTPAQDTPSAAI
ncbi:YcjF family protein [Azospirillum doebereinerae]|uniref:DUF697 domain-containing protein n=1 Tax=Azospirillum doebereinerae TaxID=92933 RepID=A0A433J7U0_9PROT|nr:YcjF family protein [Azospirillum doebereinerae]MCG5241255.1 YcjF family protein [Azospirillum doebereinerae]RUQ69738.1 DUF697 domain-containing protein [Azospirillum doebereinerae]